MTLALKSGTAALALCIFSQPLAALTAQDAWEAWKGLREANGQQIETASESYESGLVVITDANFTIDFEVEEDEGTGTVMYTVPEIRLEEQGDGSVLITQTNAYDIAFAGLDDSGAAVTGVVGLSHPDLVVVASDAEGGTQFALSGPSAELSLMEISEDGDPMDITMTIGMGAFEGAYTADGEAAISSAFNGEDLTIAVAGTDPEGDGTFAVDGTMSAVGVSSTSQGGSLFGAVDPAALIEAGFATDMEITYGETTFDFEFEDGRESGAVETSLAGGETRVSLDADAVAYDVRYDGLDVAVMGSEIPLPRVDVGMGTFGISFQMPLGEADVSQPYGFRLGLEDLSLSEGIWNLFDPAAVLPRDMASLVIDVDGQMRWLVDIFDMAMAEADSSEDVPAEVDTLNIEEVLLQLAGAELTATGGFTFDYSDLSTFDGMPRPEGAVTVVLTGANSLLDKLVQMGLVDAEQAMMARMMSGMLLQPGDGPDTLVSEIAVSPSGQITANGAPLPF